MRRSIYGHLLVNPQLAVLCVCTPHTLYLHTNILYGFAML